MGVGLNLLWILPIGCALAAVSNETKPFTGPLLNLQLKKNLSNIIDEMKEFVKEGHVEKSKVEEFEARLKAFESEASQKLAENKPYYKKMLEGADALLQYLRINSYKVCDIYPCLSEETALVRMEDLIKQLKNIVDGRYKLSEEEAADKLLSFREAADLFDAVMNDNNMSEKVWDLKKEGERYHATLMKYYNNNERIRHILNAPEPRASKNTFKGRILSREEARLFFKNANKVTVQITVDIHGVYIIYVDGKCQMYSYLIDVYLTTFRCNFEK